MGDFAQDIVQNFKTQVLCWGLEDRLSEFNETGAFSTLDVNKIIDELFEEAYIKAEKSQLEKEKDTFFQKHLKNGFVLKPTSENGCMKFQIELKGNYK